MWDKIARLFFKYLDIGKKLNSQGGSPGLLVMGRDLHTKDRGFESWHHILDGHFFTYNCCKNCNDVGFKRSK